MDLHIKYQYLFAIIVITLFSSCETNKTSSSTTATEGIMPITKSKLKTINVDFVQPPVKDIAQFISFNGKIKASPNYSGEVSSNIEGKVENIFVREGDFVKKGQAIATIASMQLIELQDQYLHAKSEADFMKIDFERQQELKKNNVGALSEYQIVETKYKTAISKEKAYRAKLELLGINVNKLTDPRNSTISKSLTIVAPIDGFIYSLPISVGMLSTPETIIAKLIDNRHLHAEIYLYDKDINQIKEGQSVKINFINASYKDLDGTVTSIDRVIDDETKAITAYIIFEVPSDYIIMPDMSIKVKVESKSNTNAGYVVPNAALLIEDENVFVFATDDISTDTLKIKKYKITFGDRNDNESEIRFNTETSKNIYIANKNPSMLEAERKRLFAE
jgi:cobalt-zinc-cadmium efflux system membrane fusion protein